eukprot:TRINITY_DN21924_c0_g2_i1.p1 TRINITY_DN21924_c0_g2~~TRINITY_DN21924_c0_g2_i1.p1  ORF type:complete len:1058 (-),score=168.17 TRINITY_DN21924_c0_g2_i1:202-3375(-)
MASAANHVVNEGEDRYVGIDLGVSCAVASTAASQTSKTKRAIVAMINEVGSRTTPSVVTYDGASRLVGESAASRISAVPAQTFTDISLLLGEPKVTLRRASEYNWLFKRKQTGQLGPVVFADKQRNILPQDLLSALLRSLNHIAKSPQPRALCVALPDFYTDTEITAVGDALRILGVSSSNLVRHSDAIATAFAHNSGLNGTNDSSDGQDTLVQARTIAFVDIGVSHASVSTVKYMSKRAEFLMRKSMEGVGVHAFHDVILGLVIPRIEEKAKCTVDKSDKSILRLKKEAERVLKQLSMLTDATFDLESFCPRGSEGPEVDVSVPITREQFEDAAGPILGAIKTLVTEAVVVAPQGAIEGIQLVGGGCRIPKVKELIQSVGEDCGASMCFGLDGTTCIAVGACAWAAGRQTTPALVSRGGLSETAIKEAKARDEEIEATHAREMLRLEICNQLETYIYQVRDWMAGPSGSLMKSEVIGPRLDKVSLFIDETSGGKDSTADDLQKELDELRAFVEREGSAYFEQAKKKKEEEEKALREATEASKQRRSDLGMDATREQKQDWQKHGFVAKEAMNEDDLEDEEAPSSGSWLQRLFGFGGKKPDQDLGGETVQERLANMRRERARAHGTVDAAEARRRRLAASAAGENAEGDVSGCFSFCFSFLTPKVPKDYAEAIRGMGTSVHTQPAPEDALHFLGGLSLGVPTEASDIALTYYKSMGLRRSKLERQDEVRWSLGASHLWGPFVCRATGRAFEKPQKWPGRIKYWAEDLAVLNDEINYLGAYVLAAGASGASTNEGNLIHEMLKGSGEASFELLIDDPWKVNRFYVVQATQMVADKVRSINPPLHAGDAKTNGVALIELLYEIPPDGSIKAIARFYKHFFATDVTEEEDPDSGLKRCFLHFSPNNVLHQTITFQEDPQYTKPGIAPEVCVYVKGKDAFRAMYDKFEERGLVHDDDGGWEAVEKANEFRARGAVDPTSGKQVAALDHLIRVASHDECPFPTLQKSTHVKLVGLKREDLNGKEGVLQDYDEAAQRWQVWLASSNSVKSIKEANLRGIPKKS